MNWLLDWWPMIAAFAVICVAWGDLRSQVTANRASSDDRHQENVIRLRRIEDKVDKINGTVHEHAARLAGLEHDSA